MDKIEFRSVVPEVFASTQLESDVWAADAVFSKGKTYLVEAESGRGKSTFCSYILGYRHDYSGDVLFDGVPTRQLRVAQWVSLRRHSLAYLFQELRLFPELTAWENVLLKNKLTGNKPETKLKDWFSRLGIEDKLDAKVQHMSFGQQQRVAMVRALAQPFDFILVDEPISHLDDRNSQIMAGIMMEEATEQGAGVIVTSIGKHMDLRYDEVLKL